MRKRLLVVNMAVTTIEAVVAVVFHTQHAVLGHKGVFVVVVHGVARNLDVPAGEVFPIKKLNPVGGFGRFGLGDGQGDNEEIKEEVLSCFFMEIAINSLF